MKVVRVAIGFAKFSPELGYYTHWVSVNWIRIQIRSAVAKPI